MFLIFLCEINFSFMTEEILKLKLFLKHSLFKKKMISNFVKGEINFSILKKGILGFNHYLY